MREPLAPAMDVISETMRPEFFSDRLRTVWPAECFGRKRDGIDVAVTPDDLTEIGKLRYELYIERDEKTYAHANPVSRTLIEPVDMVSLSFKAKRTGQLLGTVRLTRAKDALDDPHLSRLVEAIGPRDLSQTVINSRFSIRPTLQARTMITPMFEMVYHAGLMGGARYSFLATRSNLIGIFERYGWCQTKLQFQDPVAGSMKILRFDLHDLQNLRVIESPVLNIAEEWLDLKGGACPEHQDSSLHL